jgi:hypothetical protein
MFNDYFFMIRLQQICLEHLCLHTYDCPTHTCFADPVHVAVHLLLQLLLLLEQEKAGSAFHSVLLFGELTSGEGEEEKV